MKSIAKNLALAVLVLVSTTAFAQKTTTIDSGKTTVTLSTTFVEALSKLEITPGTVDPTRLFNGTVDFPVTGGAIDLDTAKGNILHSGGLTLTKNNTVVTLQSFIIDTTGSQPQITGLVSVNGTLLGRLPLFNVALPSNFSLPIKPAEFLSLAAVQIEGAELTLTSTAAGALNNVFNTEEVPANLNIGTADVLLIASSKQ